MATYSAVSASEKDADSPLTVSLIDKLDQNPHAIAEGASGAPKVQTAGLNDASVTNAKLQNYSVTGVKISDNEIGTNHYAANSVDKAALKDSSNEQSQTVTSSGYTFVINSGTHIWGPEIKVNSNSIEAYDNKLSINNQSYQGVQVVCDIVSVNTVAWVKASYITASPPHKIGELDFGPFIFVKLDTDGTLIGTWTADDPPWYWAGPTDMAPTRSAKDGKKYKKVKILPDNFDNLPRIAQLKAKAAAPTEEIEITPEYKQTDLPLIPHPYTNANNLLPGQTVLIIEPDDNVYADLISLRDDGESIADLFHDDYIRIGPESISTDRPPGVSMHKVRWKQ